MSLGPRVRKLLGPLEPRVAALYRGVFFDVGALARAVAEWATPALVLEIGCGDGALTERLAARWPSARITGIDISASPGRLFQGDRTRVEFRRQTAQDCAASEPRTYDLVIVCDVLHHVPAGEHRAFMAAAAEALAPGGRLVVKDWDRRPPLGRALAWISDRLISGSQVRFLDAVSLKALVAGALGSTSVERELRLPPWPNNVAFFARAPAPLVDPVGSTPR